MIINIRDIEMIFLISVLLIATAADQIAADDRIAHFPVPKSSDHYIKLGINEEDSSITEVTVAGWVKHAPPSEPNDDHKSYFFRFVVRESSK